MTHHPHVHGIVPGGGLSPDGERWVACRRGFFLPVRVLSRLVSAAFPRGTGEGCTARPVEVLRGYQPAWPMPWPLPLGWRRCERREWVVYAKRPFAGPQAVLAYLSRYTHRVAISNRRLVSVDEHGVTFRWKDYRAKGRTRQKTMTLSPDEFMRRFSCMCYPAAFTAFAITVCWPMPGVAGT